MDRQRASHSEDRAVAAERRAQDAAWVASVADGDQEALSRLYDRYAPLLLGMTRRVLGDPREAEEAVQDAFVQVWRGARSYDAGRSSVATWLVLIARTRAIDRLRARQSAQRAVDGLARERRDDHESPQGADNVWFSERRTRVRAALAELPDEQKAVLDMAFYEGLTQTQIAARTGLPLGTVKTRSLLGMRKLEAALKDERDQWLP